MPANSRMEMLAVAAYFVSFLAFHSFAQTTPTVDWETLKPEMRIALDKGGFPCPDELRFGPSPVEMADVTGDGIPEALVEYCHMGAYTSDFVLMQLKGGQPVTARFRDKHGEATQVMFMRGASVRNGENLTLSPAQHAAYGIHWHTNDEGALASCGVDAYVWNPNRRTFDWSAKISRQLAVAECAKVRRQIACAAGPCAR